MANRIAEEPIENPKRTSPDINSKWNYESDAPQRIISSGYRFSTHELLYLLNTNRMRGETITRIVAQSGYVSTFDDLMALLDSIEPTGGNCIEDSKLTKGSYFTFNQILTTGVLIETEFLALTLIMARHGFQFTFDEIFRLKNPAGNYGITLAHLSIHKSVQIGYRGYHEMWMAHTGQPFEKYEHANFDRCYEQFFQNPPFTVEQLIQLGNPADNDGDTVAHLMAKSGHIFTDKELMQLGESRNKKGESIADIMARKGDKLTKDEKKKLDIPLGVKARKEYLDIKNIEMVPGYAYAGEAYDFYFNGRLTYSLCDGGDMYTTIEILNQEAWSIYLDYLEKTYPGHIIDMKFIESIGYKYYK